MNKQAVEQSLPFKAVKKILKNRFPWITKIEAPEDVEKYSSLIFLEIYFNPYKFLEAYPEYSLDSFFIRHVKRDNSFKIWGSSNMGVFFKKEGESEDSKERFETFKPISDEVVKILNSVGRSNAFPQELKLNNNRTFDFNNFYIDDRTI
jgi:hypothetical protein